MTVYMRRNTVSNLRGCSITYNEYAHSQLLVLLVLLASTQSKFDGSYYTYSARGVIVFPHPKENRTRISTVKKVCHCETCLHAVAISNHI